LLQLHSQLECYSLQYQKNENKTKNYHKIKVAATHRTMHLKSNKDISNGWWDLYNCRHIKFPSKVNKVKLITTNPQSQTRIF
jgi:hypothetical protein